MSALTHADYHADLETTAHFQLAATNQLLRLDGIHLCIERVSSSAELAIENSELK